MALLAGCQPLNYEKTYTLAPGGSEMVRSDPPKYDQKVTVTATAGEDPLNLYLTLEEDAAAVDAALKSGKPPKNFLAGKDREPNPSVEAKVPAGKSFAVVLSNAGPKTVEVKLKIKGR
jgi:hypothetical protein